MTCVTSPGEFGGLAQQGSADPPHVVFDPPNTWNALGRDDERPLFLFGQIGGPQMHDTVLDGYVGRRYLRPFLRLQFGQEFVPDRLVVSPRAAWGFVDCHGECPNEVCAADDSDKLAVTHDGDALDPVRL